MQSNQFNPTKGIDYTEALKKTTYKLESLMLGKRGIASEQNELSFEVEGWSEWSWEPLEGLHLLEASGM